ncbi:AAA family ATPase [Dechloromonas sp. XY25]|uniref:AAA family ATPase n=1 Tax=Dechloromonas hankyongensis TaxID=2908002 RepID=A0ABS9K326_9RHOO|nr:AAA family ATPase [Dechloromonas hankyongensis]MCG2577460.1 AAA family ATPase [Dechloromonas hankyongensis]
MSDRAKSGATLDWWGRFNNAAKKLWSRLFDWFAAQSRLTRLAVVAICLAIVASGIYSIYLVRKQAAIRLEISAMAAAGKAGDVVGPLNDKLPVVFGVGSILPFLETHTIDRITIVYEPVMWNVSERIALVESAGKQYAFYPSDLETRIFTDKAASAPWGSKLLFIPRGDLSPTNLELFERLDLHFANARPQMEKDGWKASISGILSGTLTIGLLTFLYFQFKEQFKSLKFIEASQIQGSIDDLVGMDDIKAEVFQIMDQYERRTEYADYGIDKPFNVMFSGPAGTGKTKLASYLAKELKLPILFHSAANLETGFVAGGANTLGRIVAMARRRKKCIIFLDEAQDLFMKRGGRRKFDDDTANTLLSVLDGVRSLNDTEIIWIVASNFNSETMQMDEAMLRRFQMKVDFRHPNREERLAIITHYLDGRADKVLPDLDLRHLVAVTEGRSPADLETIINQAGILAVKAGGMIDENTLMQAAERVLVGNVNADTTMERERDRRIIAVHEWGHFLVDLAYERKRTNDDWEQILADMKTIKISLKANPRNNALGFVFHKQGNNLLKSKGDIEHDIRVLLGGMANEELFFGEEGVTNGAHNDISRVTKLLHHAVAEVGMYRNTRLNFGSLSRDGRGDNRDLDEETRTIMETQSERLYAETMNILSGQKALSAYLVDRLLEDSEMGLAEALAEIRRFEDGSLAVQAH